MLGKRLEINEEKKQNEYLIIGRREHCPITRLEAGECKNSNEYGNSYCRPSRYATGERNKRKKAQLG